MIFNFDYTYAPASSVVKIRPRPDKPGYAVEYTDKTTHSYYEPSIAQTLPNTSQLEAVCVTWRPKDDCHLVEHWPILAWRVHTSLYDDPRPYADPILHRRLFPNELIGILNPATGVVDVPEFCTYNTVDDFVAGAVAELKGRHLAEPARIEDKPKASGPRLVVV